jgi:hypothetical protein
LCEEYIPTPAISWLAIYAGRDFFFWNKFLRVADRFQQKQDRVVICVWWIVFDASELQPSTTTTTTNMDRSATVEGAVLANVGGAVKIGLLMTVRFYANSTVEY